MMAIDYVVPMVFDDDVLWQNDFIANHKATGYKVFNNVRYRSFDLEELLIKCIKKFMPFVQTIHIILARESQKRYWMEQEGVNVVLHEEFIPRKYLPCFNSCTIEMFIPFIQGLSEHFIYGNDDMFPLAHLTEHDFFENGKPCQHVWEEPYPEEPNLFQRKCMNQQNMIGSVFGKHYESTWLRNGHSMAPMVKSSCLEVRNRFDNDITKGISLVRKSTSYNQYIYVLWQQFTGNYVNRTPKTVYVSVKSSLEKVKNILLDPHTEIACVNDHESILDITKYSVVMKDCIENRLSI